MVAELIYQSKIHLLQTQTETVAIAELRVWKIPIDSEYPEGLKYSLYLVEKATGKVILGYDNHKPKGHHFHYKGEENPFKFVGVDELIDRFWKQVQEEGYLI